MRLPHQHTLVPKHRYRSTNLLKAAARSWRTRAICRHGQQTKRAEAQALLHRQLQCVNEMFERSIALHERASIAWGAFPS